MQVWHPVLPLSSFLLSSSRETCTSSDLEDKIEKKTEKRFRKRRRKVGLGKKSRMQINFRDAQDVNSMKYIHVHVWGRKRDSTKEVKSEIKKWNRMMKRLTIQWESGVLSWKRERQTNRSRQKNTEQGDTKFYFSTLKLWSRPPLHLFWKDVYRCEFLVFFMLVLDNYS